MWVKIDDALNVHPKMVLVGPLGFALHVAALCHSNRYLTDGFVDARVVDSMVPGLNGKTKTVATSMVKAGLWTVVEGGWQIHDYAEYQKPAAVVQAERAEAKERMRAIRKKRSPEVRPNEPRSSPVVRNPRTRTRTTNTTVVEVVPKEQDLEVVESVPRASEIAARFVDAYRESHGGAEPMNPGAMANQIQRALKAKHPPAIVRAAAIEAGRRGLSVGGYLKLLSDKTGSKTAAKEPKGWDTLRQTMGEI